MNSPVLVGALVAPLVGALVAVLVPSGRRRSPVRRPSGPRPAGEGGAEAVEAAETEITLVVALPEPEGDAAVIARAGVSARTVVRVAALSAAGLWMAVLVMGGASAGRFVAEGAVAPAGAGAALALAAVTRPTRRGPAGAGALALALVSGGLALAAGDGPAAVAASALAGGVVVAALVTARENDGGLGPLALALAGMTAVAGGLAQQRGADISAAVTSGSAAGVLLVVGGASIAAAGGLRSRRTGAVLLPVGLVVGVAGASSLGTAGEATAVVLALAAVATAGAWAMSSGGPGGMRLAVVSLALFALAASAVPPSGLLGPGLLADGGPSPDVPAAWLLAAAAVVTSVVLVPLAALSALPGAATFAVAAAVDPEPVRLVVAGLALVAAVAAAVAVQRSPVTGGEADDAGGPVLSPLVAGVPALAVAAWLLVAPRTWAWVGDDRLVAWPDSVALAVAGGLIAAVAAVASGRLALPGPPCLAAPDPGLIGPDAPAARLAALAAAAALGLALIVLVVSSGQAG